MKHQPVLLTRRDAAQATLDRFKDQPFQWGKFDCAKMVAFHLRHLGYRIGISKAGTYSTALGAKRGLKRMGWPSLTHGLDEVLQFERIAPAALLVGDLLQLESEGPLEALAIAMGNGRALSYHEDTVGAVVVQPVQIVAAWRVRLG